jgi:sulfatase modifying factor 1
MVGSADSRILNLVWFLGLRWPFHEIVLARVASNCYGTEVGDLPSRTMSVAMDRHSLLALSACLVAFIGGVTSLFDVGEASFGTGTDGSGETPPDCATASDGTARGDAGQLCRARSCVVPATCERLDCAGQKRTCSSGAQPWDDAACGDCVVGYRLEAGVCVRNECSSNADCAPVLGDWGACDAADACAESGLQTRTVSASTCSGGRCVLGAPADESQGCPRATAGTVCAEGAGLCVGGICKVPVCGNGRVELGEGSDDGNTRTEACAYGETSCTVCSAACQSVAGATSFCGDGTFDAAAGEACDDGNDLNTDGCTPTCEDTRCGDGVVQGFESCDDGNDLNTDGCTFTCANARCGDGFVRSGVEVCDDGDTDNTDECSNDCQSSRSPLGTACTSNAQCASGFCATAPDGTANDRCAPPGMVWIPAGTFTMGSPSAELGRDTDETEQSVTLTRAFFMDRTEVTQGAWKDLSSGVNPSCFQATTGTSCATGNANDNGPVERLDWYSALAFANAKSVSERLTACYTLTGCTDATNGWKDGQHTGCTGATFAGLGCKGYRLPTEAEWEYAARAGTTGATYAGDLSVLGCDDTTLPSIAWFCGNSGDTTHAVGQKQPNAWGLRDMLGNVHEWTWDYGSSTYYPGTVTDPLGSPTGSSRVFRGGSWVLSAHYSCSAARVYFDPGLRYNYLGLRLARTANP